MMLQERRRDIVRDLLRLPEMIKRVLQLDGEMNKLAEEMYKERSMLLIGRGYQYASCAEGALKIKELSYMHSEGMLSGELKHGPLALVDEFMPIVIICVRDKCYEKTMNAFSQVLARRARPVVICNEGDEAMWTQAHRVVSVPQIDPCLQGILTTIPLQLLSYHLATLRGCDVDQPRNLAKSVTTH